MSARCGEDDDALLRYLTWEASAPNCLELENALLKALRKLPWEEMLVNSVLSRLRTRPNYKVK